MTLQRDFTLVRKIDIQRLTSDFLISDKALTSQMFSYIGQLQDGWHGSYDDEDHYHYFYLFDVHFSVSRMGSLHSLDLTFNVTDKRKGDALIAFLEGRTSKVEIDGSEGSIIIQNSTDKRQFIFTVCYQGPYVKLNFSLDCEVCFTSFACLLSDLKKYPHPE